MRLRRFIIGLGLVLLTGQNASAHFQMLHIDQFMRDKGGEVTVSMPFTHPSHGGPMMNMDEPFSLTMRHKGKTTDLNDNATKIEWQGVGNKATAYSAKAKLRGLGDYIFAFTPAPYLEESEDAYIQQFTKTVVNVGGLPTGWNESLLLDAEIVPDQQPYGVYAGGLFSGVVLAQGKPLAGIEVEVEFLNHEINETNDGFKPEPFVEYPRDNLNIMTIRTDKDGRFFFGIPHEGYWGFAALSVGKKVSYKGRDLSQDAVLWVQAHKLKWLR